ncbi:MAG: nucleotidyltransferase domain-containing protein [Candidatus Woesearchaeota archaeon]
MADEQTQTQPAQQQDQISSEKLKQIQAIVEKFKDKVVERFEGYVSGVSLLPPGRTIEHIHEPEPQSQEEFDKQQQSDNINVLVLIDDTEPTKMSKLELRDKLDGVIKEIAKNIDSRLNPQTLIYTELWQYCFDSKTEILQIIAAGATVYDTGMLSAIKISEVHKALVLQKFEKYIVSYVLAGSFVQGRSTEKSDIDVFIVIDDTDVKKMTRVELKDKLRGIILSMASQASEMTGISRQFQIQTYILTDFWDSIKEANPVIFTFLRDGVPFYDRGIFMPWKQLLRLGKIKPSMESIDMYMSTGEQMLERTKFKLKEIGMEDTYYSIIYPAQASLMLYGLPPPTPRETAELMEKIFVKEEKLLEPEYVKILQNNIQLRKELEHDMQKEVDVKEIDRCIKDSAKFLKRIRKLFTDIEQQQLGKSIEHTYDQVVTVIRDILSLENVKSVKDEKLLDVFKETVVSSNKLPVHVVRQIELIFDAYKQKKKLHKSEIEKLRMESHSLLRVLVEYIERVQSKNLAKTRIRVKYGEKIGEVFIFGQLAYAILDVLAQEREYVTAHITPTGGFGKVSSCNVQEFEKALVQETVPKDFTIKSKTYSDLKTLFGTEVEVLPQ